jgi:hypothetical protein
MVCLPLPFHRGWSSHGFGMVVVRERYRAGCQVVEKKEGRRHMAPFDVEGKLVLAWEHY